MAHAEAEVAEIQSTIAAEEVQRIRFGELLKRPIIGILLAGCVLAVLQQWSAINVFFNYAEEIFKSGGFGEDAVLTNILATGAVNLVFTFVALGTVDRTGRRSLMLIGFAGIALCHVLIAFAYMRTVTGTPLLALTLTAIGIYAMSLAPVTWVLISEIFPNRIRGAAVSVAVCALWIGCFFLTYLFPLMKKGLGMTPTFFIYAAICVVGFFFIFKKIPETKGKSLEEIERLLTGKQAEPVERATPARP